jgi:hypothetical protein
MDTILGCFHQLFNAFSLGTDFRQLMLFFTNSLLELNNFGLSFNQSILVGGIRQSNGRFKSGDMMSLDSKVMLEDL